MKSFRSQSGPFGERVYYDLEEIENICMDALRAENCLPQEPAAIRIDRFIEKRWGNIRYENLSDAILGGTEFDTDGAVRGIVVSVHLDGDSSRPGERRLRSTLAHESGHGLLHAHLFAKANARAQTQFADWSNKDAPRILCRDVHGASEKGAKGGYDGRWWEYQANRAIGALLLPKALLAKSMESFCTKQGVFETPVITDEQREEASYALAELFDVNPAVTRIRIADRYPKTDDAQLTL